MPKCVLLKIVTDYKINAIKEIRAKTGWGLYETKEAVENGLIFDSMDQMVVLMNAIRTNVDGNAKFEVSVWRSGGPQDARGVNFGW